MGQGRMDFIAAPPPGISFDVVSPTPRPLLPRMDIAGFVGFAAAGPLHIPVAVDSIEQFRDIYGPDVQLAWDQAAGHYLSSHLGQTVSAFFRGGGRRCWVVRVGRRYSPTRFALPFVFAADTLTQADIAARSQGSWADRLRVATRLKPTVLRLVKIEQDAGSADQFVLTTVGSRIISGDLIRVPLNEEPLELLFLQVTATDGGQHQVTSTGTPLWVRWDPASETWQQRPPQPLPVGSIPAARLLFDIWVWEDEQLRASISNLGFLAAHPRFWGRLTSDEALFAIEDIFTQERHWNSFESEILSPRFPLAIPEDSHNAYLPLGMESALKAELAVPASAAGRSVDPLERDGVAAFGSDLFTDDQLAPFSSRTLMAEANQRYYLEKRSRYAEGIHALLPLEEVTLIAVPDAVHPGWEKTTPPLETILPPPDLSRPSLEKGKVLEWKTLTLSNDSVFEIEWADEPAFIMPSKTEYIFDEPAEIYHAALPLSADCPRRWFARVRERREGLLSPFSNTVSFFYPPDDFENCCDNFLEAPILAQAQPASSDETIAFIATATLIPDECATGSPPDIEGGDPSFEIELAQTPDFYNPTLIFKVAVLEKSPPQWACFFETRFSDYTLYARVRLVANNRLSAWSNSIIILSDPKPVWEIRSFNEGTTSADHLTAVHRAMIHLCRARKDMVALLSLPHEFGVRDAIAYPDQLTNESVVSATGVPVIRDQRASLSCAALYHPWFVTGNDQPRPPDGAAAGLIASTVLERGAWIAPANRPLRDVVVLSPTLTAEEENELLGRQLNPLRQTPRGFLVLSAETLSRDSALRPLNVRRLLMLLYRQALQEGQTFVFEPLSPVFRRLVQHRYEQLLAFLYARGALAGESPAEAFQVITDDRVNTARSIDAGRFVIELRVAPSQPLAFISIKLIQTEQAGLTLSEG